MAQIEESGVSTSDGLKAYELKLRAKEQAERDKRKKQIVYSLCFILAAFIIVYIFPSGNKFRFSYELGKPWIYEPLTAPGSFPIMKSAEEMDNDYSLLLKQYYTPYFSTDAYAKQSIAERFVRGNKNATEKFGEEYSLYITKMLGKICNTGILSNNSMDDISKLGISKIKIRQEDKDGEAFYADKEIKSLFTQKSAYEYIMKNAPADLDKRALQSFNINQYITPTLVFEEELSNKQKADVRNLVSDTRGMVQDGQKIIDRGEIVSADSYRILNSLKHETESGNMGSTSKTAGAGQLICVFCILLALNLYFILFRDHFITIKHISFVLGLIIGMCALTAYVTKMSYEIRTLSVYVIPYAMVPITVSTFFDTRTGLFSHLTTVLICSMIAPHEFEFLLLQILIGMICISTLKKFYQRSQLIKCALTICAVYLLTYAGLSLTHTVGWSDNDTYTMVSFFINCGFLLFTYPLIFVFEKTFGFVSDITLVELSNTNNPLLRSFAEVAPGSFQHSLTVSNLAGDAADYIGCNALLARAGALYHDIGKMANPIYFTENQNGGYNPHKDLSMEKSIEIIRAHVNDGIDIAKRYGLPKKLIDFIETHHGKNPLLFFYRTYKKAHPDEEVNIADFSHNGKLPTTKEQSILMICDAVEAASRSLPEYTEDAISKKINDIVSEQIEHGAFAETPITLKEIELVKCLLTEKLKTMYHTRIRYPELDKKKA